MSFDPLISDLAAYMHGQTFTVPTTGHTLEVTVTAIATHEKHTTLALHWPTPDAYPDDPTTGGIIADLLTSQADHIYHAIEPLTPPSRRDAALKATIAPLLAELIDHAFTTVARTTIGYAPFAITATDVREHLDDEYANVQVSDEAIRQAISDHRKPLRTQSDYLWPETADMAAEAINEAVHQISESLVSSRRGAGSVA